MNQISCLVCEKTLRIPKYIDTGHFDGQIICKKCNSLLHLKLEKEKVQKYEIIQKRFLPPKEVIVNLTETDEVREKDKEI